MTTAASRCGGRRRFLGEVRGRACPAEGTVVWAEVWRCGRCGRAGFGQLGHVRGRGLGLGLWRGRRGEWVWERGIHGRHEACAVTLL